MAQSDTLVVSYIGSFGSANALPPIIDAAEILQRGGCGGIELHLYGRGPIKEQLQSEVQKRKLANVTFHSEIAKGELYKVGGLSDAFIVNVRNLDLYQYGISLNKIYDYMAMARPIIIASGAANNPVAEAGSGICVGADDSKGMASAMVELKRMSEESLFELGIKGREYVSKLHSFEILGKKYGEVILSAAKGDRAAI